jgi:uncharacterized membrane protein
MTAPHADQIIAGYFARLETALVPVAIGRRQELLEEFRAHIAEARSALSNESDADLLNILDRLGDPADTAAAEIGRAESNPPIQATSRALEIAAIVLLLLFWPVGVVLLWISNAWTTRDKLIGTLVPPGGYLGILLAGPLLLWATVGPTCATSSDQFGRVISSTCPSGGQQALIDIGFALIAVFYLVSPILSAVYLAIQLRRRAFRPNHIGQSDVAPPLAKGSPPLIDVGGGP